MTALYKSENISNFLNSLEEGKKITIFAQFATYLITGELGVTSLCTFMVEEEKSAIAMAQEIINSRWESISSAKLDFIRSSHLRAAAVNRLGMSVVEQAASGNIVEAAYTHASFVRTTDNYCYVDYSSTWFCQNTIERQSKKLFQLLKAG